MKNVFMNLVLGIVLISSLVFLLLPYVSGVHYVSVLSNSMSPSFNAGDVLVVAPTNVIQEEDVISFWSGGSLVTHRVLEVNGQSFITKGDANEDADLGEVSRSEILGKVVFNIPFMGVFTSFVRTIYGFILFILLPGLLIIGYELKRIYQHIHKRKRTDNSTVCVLLFLLIISTVVGSYTTFSYFSDVEVSEGNIIQVANWEVTTTTTSTTTSTSTSTSTSSTTTSTPPSSSTTTTT